MRIIISPAKKMVEDVDSLPWQDLPRFLPQTEEILAALRKMTPAQLQKLWKCNDKLAALNVERLEQMDLRARLTPAILAYEGIQYRYMAPGVFTEEQLRYVQEHLRILSGFYGVLRPFDGVVSYRLEMQAKLKVCEAKDLYSYWNNSLAENIFQETDCIINLASKEYSQCVSKYLPEGVQFITCIFGEEKDGKIIEKGTQCKMARGEMVRYMAETNAQRPEDLRGFDRLNFHFDPQRSDESRYVFVAEKPAKEE